MSAIGLGDEQVPDLAQVQEPGPVRARDSEQELGSVRVLGSEQDSELVPDLAQVQEPGPVRARDSVRVLGDVRV